MNFKRICMFLLSLNLLCLGRAYSQEISAYVGSKACAECHEQEYNNFVNYSKKAKSWQHIQVLAPKLTTEELKGCYECHTTGYNKGGFISYEKTPQLSDVGCETCHGPGKKHIDAGGDPDLIKAKVSQEGCSSCHNEKRVKAFNFKPLIYGGVH
ncbi:multiheme c-type cytochrome [Desulfovulcanus sp.]